MRWLAILLTSFLPAMAAPVLVTIDGTGTVGGDPSLQMRGSSLAVSYWDWVSDDLKFASCESDCANAASWRLSTVDSAGKVGMYTSLALNNGNPVISYRDLSGGALKLATCTAGCWTSTPTWVIVTVDATSPNTGLFTSLQLRDGKPVIAYRDLANGDLKLATCTARCATSNPDWIIVTVDSVGDVGRSATLRLAGGTNPVISYFDVTNGRVKLATCTAGCATSTPSWAISFVDGVFDYQDTRFSMQLDGADNPIISYWDSGTGGVRLATCVAACASSSPSWVLARLDPGRFTGDFTSVQIVDGKPVIAYYGESGLKLAVCTDRCATEQGAWTYTLLENGGSFGTGWYPSLQVRNGTAYIAYYDPAAATLRLAIVAGATAANYQALWWGGPSESGWGLNIAHQGDVMFLTWFTYDTDGTGMWLLAPDVRKGAGNSYSGQLFRARGPSFDTVPFDFSRVTLAPVGTATLQFADADTGSFQYAVNGVTQTKAITRLIFDPVHASACSAGGAPGAAPNYQDLWIAPNAAEAGWGVNITHQGDILFATWFTYEASGKGQWFVMSKLDAQAPGRYAGAIYRTTGPAFSTVPFNPGAVVQTPVGNAVFDFNASPATFTYTVGAVTQTRAMQRFLFASPATVCR